MGGQILTPLCSTCIVTSGGSKPQANTNPLSYSGGLLFLSTGHPLSTSLHGVDGREKAKGRGFVLKALESHRPRVKSQLSVSWPRDLKTDTSPLLTPRPQSQG